jgi:hypothetical protein
MVAGGIIAAIVPIAMNLLLTTPAFAYSLQTFTNQNTGLCLHSGHMAEFHNQVYTYRCDSAYNFTFAVNRWADGTREVQATDYYTHQPDGYCLDDSWGANLRWFPCNKSTWQSWYIDYPGDGTIIFRNQETGRCLDDSWDYGTRTFTCNWASLQRWY